MLEIDQIHHIRAMFMSKEVLYSRLPKLQISTGFADRGF